MKMRKLIATKSHQYGTRQLTAGEEYELPVRHAVALVAAKKARFADKAAPRAPVKPAPQAQPRPAEPPTPASIDDLRQQATQLGIMVDGRWGAGRLQYEIDKVKG